MKPSLAQVVLVAVLMTALLDIAGAAPPATAERWDIFELEMPGPADGNPFVNVKLFAQFTSGGQSATVSGFYDGQGIYRIRFSPPTEGQWSYRTQSNRPQLDGKSGEFQATAARGPNRGPVRVHNTFHFAYADGTPYWELGTTCYAWTHQGDALEEQTLHTLAGAPFNKIRMCVFPKSYNHNRNEPVYYPFAGTPPRQWDFSRFNPEFFRHFENRLAQLRDLGIEADIILFHPYDRWGFADMGAENDDRYLRYVVARLSAYRNVWWSIANEFDFVRTKREADWDRFFQIVQKEDPYGHLRSIHNGSLLYDNNKPWVTHASIQNGSAVEDFGRAQLYRDVWRKPIVFDEVKYEGDITERWGNLSAEEMVRRFWEGLIAGTYVGHGETYLHPQDDVLWWSKGGVLRGQSPPRLAFFKRIMEAGPADGIEPIDKWQDCNAGGRAPDYYLFYFGTTSPASWRFELPRSGGVTENMKFRAEVIDTWNMTITSVADEFVTKKKDGNSFEDVRKREISLPSRKWMALRIVRLR